MSRLIASLSFMWLLMAISTMAQSPPVLDSEGQPLRRGVEYQAEPAAVADIASGLTLVARNGSCPFYVGQEICSRGISCRPGIPVIFTPTNPDETIITEATEFTVAFSGSSTCVRTTTWSIGEEDPETRRRFLVTGSGEPDVFNISSDDDAGRYTIRWCPACLGVPPNCGRPRCGSAGILVQNGTRFLVLDGPAFRFRFIRTN